MVPLAYGTQAPLVLTVTEYELCMQAWLKDSLIDMMIDIQETLIERIQKLN